MRSQDRRLPPVLILGGVENALSVTRSLTRRGVTVRLSAPATSSALHSRYCAGRYVIPPGQSQPEFWYDLLLRGRHPELAGSVVFPCDDTAIEFMAGRRAELDRHYLVGDHVPSQQLALLDKQKTLRLARVLGVPTPYEWSVGNAEDVDALPRQLDFPLLIKPIHSHRFREVYRRKLLVAHDRTQLRAGVADALSRGLAVMVCEMIPGPDTQLSSYYTYIDKDENHLFHFTKRVLRRSPPNFGGGSYHITEWLPETAEMGRRFFQGIGFRGLGNIELKRDPRDGQLKMIEVNARFTAAQELLVRAGMDTAWIVYSHIVGEQAPRVESYRQRVRMWYPLRDFDALRSLRARGELSVAGWLRSITHRQVLPFFSAADPVPALVELKRLLDKRRARRANGVPTAAEQPTPNAEPVLEPEDA